MPFTDTAASLKDPSRVAYRFYYGTVHWVKGMTSGEKGEIWYSIYDDKFKKNYYARAEHMRLLALKRTTPDLPGDRPGR